MDIYRRIYCSLLLLVVLSGGILADDNIVSESATAVKFDFAKQCRVGNHIFVLEKATLTDVIEALGSGVIQGVGADGADRGFVVDYRDGDQWVRFYSNAEMGGDKHLLGAVEIRPLTVTEKASKISVLPLSVVFPFGSIKTSFADLAKILGPSKKTHGIVWYTYSNKTPIKVSSGKVLDYDVNAALRLKIVNGRVDALHLTHVTSY